MMQDSYQQIRQRLIELSVEIEDRDRAVETLQKAINAEQEALYSAEQTAGSDYAAALDVLRSSHEQQLQGKVRAISELTTARKKLIEDCKDAVAEYKQLEDALKSELTNLRHHARTAVAEARMQWTQGQSERQAAFIALKRKEAMESTKKALQPEISRLTNAHDNEVANVKHRLEIEKEDLTRTFNQFLEDMVREEQAQHQEARATELASLERQWLAQVQQLKREHQQRLKMLATEHANELRELAVSMLQETEKLREHQSSEFASMNGSVQKRVREAREAHQEEIATLQQAHEEEVRKIKDTMTIEKEAIQRQIKQQIENQHAPALQEMAEKIQQTRDARIQEFIRELQNDQLEVEVRTNAQISEQQANRHQEMEEELEQLRANTRRWNDKAADVVCIRDDTHAALDEHCVNLSALKRTADDLVGSNTELHTTVNELKAAVVQLHQEYQAINEKNNSGEENDPEVAHLRSEYAELLSQIQQADSRFKIASDEMEVFHEQELLRLDHNVKTQVTALDGEISVLRDAVHTEKIRQERVKGMIARYSATVLHP